MTPEYWQKVKAVLSEAAAVSPSGRPDFFERVCGSDKEMRREVESLLEFDDPDFSVFDDPLYSINDAEHHVNQTFSFIGKEIGNYRIVETIAAGGMGTVFLAERADGTFDQKVALKIIKRGMDSDVVLRRFFNERRILASLDHPFISRLLDGGTTDENVPYFVMEFVDGIPITKFAEQNKLSIDERLRLFAKVASAVSYAHQNLVIHRDLKPSNILVTSSGDPKLLDFGIAKLLMSGNGGMITATQQFILTPDYASPEQVRGEQLSTSTDIYSLGVILYELLTGVRPYFAGDGNFAEMIRIVCDTIPVPPSRSCPAEASRLKGDLDNIVSKALRKEPERRYRSVEQLAVDVQRHLEKLPVSAGSDSWRYRAGKFISRHKVGATAAGLILCTLIAGFGATLYQMSIVRYERAKAERRFNDVRQLANTFLFEINEKIGESPIKARELVITRSLEYLDKLARESDGDVELQSELATAYEKIGKVQAELFHPGLGKTADALVSHQKALEIRQKIFSIDENNVMRGSDVVRSEMLVGDINSMIGKIDEARSDYQRAAGLGEKLLSLEPENTGLKRGLSPVYARLGQNVLRSGSLGKALEYYERSLAINRELLADSPDDISRQHSISVIYNYIGFVKMEMLQFDEALTYFTNELEIDETFAAIDPNNAQYLGYISDGNFWVGVARSEMNDPKAALTHLTRSFNIQKSLTEADPANLGNRNGLADCQIELGKALQKNGQIIDAVRILEEAVGNYRMVSAADIQNLNAVAQVQLAQRLLAEALIVKGEKQRAESLLLRSIAENEKLIGNEPNNSNWQNELALCRLKLGKERSRSRRPALARTDFQAASEIFERISAASPENLRLRRDADLAASYLSGGNR